MNGSATGRHFVFVLDDGFTMQAFSSAVEVLRLLERVRPGSGYSYSAASLSGDPVAASNGFRVIPDADVKKVPPRAVIVVVAGVRASQSEEPALASLVRGWARKGHPVWGISSGVVRLAQSGVLNNRRVAAHWEDVSYLRDRHPLIEVSASLFVSDGDVMTCAGGGAASDMMLTVLRRDLGGDIADEIAARLVIDAVRGGRVRQRRALEMRFETRHPVAFAALRLMRANLLPALPITAIARAQGVSERQLERVFAREFGKTPSALYLELRFQDARSEVRDGRRSLTEIAMDHGYSPAGFARSYRRLFGLLPSEDRRKAMSETIT
ncbi:GlxA family transcriptional regulator [Ruegeria marina]|uniref:Transcriptional regulator, AraC family with amidase-like domain n=1 Tax=Ruegeria marina TaxID=639004 RepID=A0A1G6QD11_9RHOB|nr:helix-turn-helix domain-containing protein [Ruegeria marina]SDC90382.1 transcriptional regulator, AraC family with amidase-like domain [Ruegeria marina]